MPRPNLICSVVYLCMYIGMFCINLRVLKNFCYALQDPSCARVALYKLVCKNCKCANELDLHYCKFCGLERGGGSLDVRQTEDDLSSMKSIDDRIKLLNQRLDASSYSQQKCNIKK